jgi:hypothetical protein
VGDEAVFSNGHKLTDKGVGLNATSLADDNATLNLNKRADKAIVPDIATIQIDWLNDSDSFAKAHVEYSRRPNHRLTGYVFHRRSF